MSLLDWVREIVEGVETTVTGMRTTATFAAENLRGDPSGAVTLEYPAQKAILPERFRGHLFNDVDTCISCKLCARVCPVDCFVIDTEKRADNKLRASRFDIDLTKCIYCGLCTRVCPPDSLTMQGGFELEPRNVVNERGERFLFTQRPDQLDERLDSADMERLNAISGKPYSDLTAEERAFLDKIEDPKGNTLVAKFGLGFYTAAEKAQIEAEREAALKAKADAAKKAAAEKAAAKAAAATPEDKKDPA